MPNYASKINIDGTDILLKGVPSPVVSRGTAGLCPALPSGSGTTKYLREDGTWIVPPNTTYGVVSKTANGLCPQLPNETTTTKYLRQDGTWVKPPNTTYSTFTRSSNGLVPASGGSTTTKYLREDGSWQTPPNTNYIKRFGVVTLNYFSNIYLRGYISAPTNATVIATLATDTDSVTCIRAIMGASGTCEIRALGNFSSGASVNAYYVVLYE